MAKSPAAKAGKSHSAPLFSLPLPPPRLVFLVFAPTFLPPISMGRGRPRKKVQRSFIELQSVSSGKRCVWCGADQRGTSSLGALRTNVDMVTISATVAKQLLLDHHRIAHVDGRICKVICSFSRTLMPIRIILVTTD